MRTPRVRAAGLAIDICTWLCSCRAKYRSGLPHASQVALSGHQELQESIAAHVEQVSLALCL